MSWRNVTLRQHWFDAMKFRWGSSTCEFFFKKVASFFFFQANLLMGSNSKLSLIFLLQSSTLLSRRVDRAFPSHKLVYSVVARPPISGSGAYCVLYCCSNFTHHLCPKRSKPRWGRRRVLVSGSLRGERRRRRTGAAAINGRVHPR
jgi:hypothetical protein